MVAEDEGGVVGECTAVGEKEGRAGWRENLRTPLLSCGVEGDARDGDSFVAGIWIDEVGVGVLVGCYVENRRFGA